MRKLRALWSLYVIGASGQRIPPSSSRSRARVRAGLGHSLADRRHAARHGLQPTDWRGRRSARRSCWRSSRAMARDDSSGLVRLVLASTLQRLPVNRRIDLARALLSHAEDASDHNLPALIWMGLIPVAESNAAALASLASDARQPSVVRLIARRLGEDIDSRPDPLNALLSSSGSRPAEFRARSSAVWSTHWPAFARRRNPKAGTRFKSQLDTKADPGPRRTTCASLNVLFGDGRALEEVRRLALDEKAEVESRKAALRTLIESRPSDLRSICERLVRVRYLNAVAVRGLALFDDPEIGKSLVRNYRAFHPSDRPAVLDVLVSRPSFARALLEQVAAGQIPRGDLTAFHARQIQSLGDATLSRQLSLGLGRDPRVSDADRRDRIDQLKQTLDHAATRPGRPWPRTRGVRPDLQLVPQALRRRRRDRPGPDRIGPRQSGLSAREHHRPQRDGRAPTSG